MKYTTAVLGTLLVTSVQGFQTTTTKNGIGNVALHMGNSDDGELSRRSLMKFAGAALVGVSEQGFSAGPASAGLLEEFGTDPTAKIEDKPKGGATKKDNGQVVVAKKAEVDFEPNLRSNYYYPTNKKRYLPRIKKCNDAIPGAAEMIGSGDWDGAKDFAEKTADNTILPMKLYTSSLLGGGTNVKVSFAKDMNQAATDFEKAQKALVKAIAKKDQEKSSTALEDLSSALLAYRTAGKLLGPDGGGDIPSVDEIRRSACKVQGRTFEKKVLERDARLKAAASS